MSDHSVTIEAAGSAALDEAVQLLRAQFDDHDIAVVHSELTEAARALCDGSGRGLLLIARARGEAVGVAALTFTWSLEHGGRVAWLEELYVVPAERERGIGSQLLQQACARAKDAGCRALDLEVTAEHVRAEHLYRRHGFRFLGRNRWALRLAPRPASSA